MILGIGGKAGAGKSTVTEYLVNKKKYEEIELAGNMKRFLSHELRIPLSSFYDIEEKNKVRSEEILITPDLVKKVSNLLSVFYPDKKISFEENIVCFSYRELLQKFGTEVLRRFDEDVHIHWGFSTASKWDNVILQAIRFPNELNFVKEKNGFNIYIDREDPAVLNSQIQKEHSSENSVNKEDFDFIINNNYSLSFLYANIESILIRIKNEREGNKRD